MLKTIVFEICMVLTWVFFELHCDTDSNRWSACLKCRKVKKKLRFSIQIFSVIWNIYISYSNRKMCKYSNSVWIFVVKKCNSHKKLLWITCKKDYIQVRHPNSTNMQATLILILPWTGTWLNRKSLPCVCVCVLDVAHAMHQKQTF